MSSLIKSVVISEKSTDLINKKVFVLHVDQLANKVMIKKYLEKQFDIEVKSVRISNLKSKHKRKGRQVYKTPPKKKAYITLASNKNLDKIKTLF